MKRCSRRISDRECASSIDKTNLVELSEAINSMYRYYQESSICYAYLVDISAADIEETLNEMADLKGWLKISRWFSRGWTLQELIAPRFVEFYTKGWTEI